jgi:dTDP-4-dehydrorhamnose 3,5-epimerase
VIFTETALPGAFIIEPELREDERGFFARAWCREEFEAHGLDPRLVQVNLSWNHSAGTLRGMHYQRAPHGEAKLVRCTRGRIWDAIVDLRPASPAFGRWVGVELSARNRAMLYVPEGFAHGYLTLEDDTEVLYQVSEFYTPGAEGGVRHDDAAFAIAWPVPITVISDKDRAWPDYILQGAAA